MTRPWHCLCKTPLLFPLRALACVVGTLMCWMEGAADWVVGARGATEYVREGACRRCGRCCQLLGMELPRWIAGRRLLVRIARAWHVHVMNFEPAGETADLLTYRCRYYREGRGPARHGFAEGVAGGGEAGGCSIYPFRHRICRFFPRQRLYGHPALDPGCGYRFVRREVLARRKERARDGRSDFSSLLR